MLLVYNVLDHLSGRFLKTVSVFNSRLDFNYAKQRCNENQQGCAVGVNLM